MALGVISEQGMHELVKIFGQDTSQFCAALKFFAVDLSKLAESYEGDPNRGSVWCRWGRSPALPSERREPSLCQEMAGARELWSFVASGEIVTKGD